MMDQLLEKERIEQNSLVGYTSAKEYFYSKVNTALGSPGLPAGIKDDVFPKNIPAAVQDFFNKINLLSTTPESYSLKIAVINSAEHLSSSLNNTAYKLENLRLQTDEMIQKSCSSINENLHIIDKINSEICRSNQDSKVRLESKKIQAIHNLAEYIDISINENKEGQVQIYTSGGKEITKNQFQHQALPNVDWVINDQEFNPIFLKTITKTEEINCFSSGKIQGF